MSWKMSPQHELFLHEAIKKAVSPGGQLPSIAEVIAAGYNRHTVNDVRNRVKIEARKLLLESLKVMSLDIQETDDDDERARRYGLALMYRRYVDERMDLVLTDRLFARGRRK